MSHASLLDRFADESVGFVLLDLGVSPYEQVYATQLELVAKKKHQPGSADYLLLVEHPDVYTFGRRSKADPAAERLPQKFFVERGGEVTYHNPGQLVGYPILALREDERDIHAYLRKLEGALINVLSEFGIRGERREGATGVWLHGRTKKIASIGVAVSSWVTYHGFALNVENNLRGFSRIQPCGFASGVMTSLKEELGQRCPGMEAVKEAVLWHFSRQFDRHLLS
jgi:lipoyl(octanoyl) transferase